VLANETCTLSTQDLCEVERSKIEDGG
jgi:hypothetical protein